MPDPDMPSTRITADASKSVTSNEGTAQLTYVLVTPARNEAAFIEGTIQSVIRQTVRPVRWVIVSDGSTDGTDEIVKTYSAQYDWIELHRMSERRERHFAGKAYAFNAGYAQVAGLQYDVIGNLDADLTFDAEYMAFLLDKFLRFPRLGVAGTPFREGTEQYDFRFTSTDHVSGACQLFRRECFEEIGGYVPLKQGGVDLAAVITARMKGWQTRTFTEKVSEHHKKSQSGRHSTFVAMFKSGYHDYLMGTHPLWQTSRSVYQMSRRPIVLGGMALLAGYFWAFAKRADRLVSDEFTRFRRSEQMARLAAFATSAISRPARRDGQPTRP